MEKMGTVILVSILLVMIARCEGLIEYEYFQVVQQWQPATCSDAKLRTECWEMPPWSFSIHGVWPSLYSGERLDCSGSPFDASKIVAIEAGLNAHWADVINRRNSAFWNNEWSKHGTCSEPYYNQLQYFAFGLNAFALDDLEAILSGYSIRPAERTYTRDEIQEAISRATGRRPALRCNTNYWSGRRQLHEITVCYNKNAYAPIDCPFNVNNCPYEFDWNV